MFGTQLAVALKLLPQRTVRHEDDPLFAALANYEDLTSVRGDVADLKVRQLADAQPSHDQQLYDQERSAILRGLRRVPCTSGRSCSVGAFLGVENRFEDVPINGPRQATRDPHGDTDVGERGGQGAVPIFAPRIVRLEGHEPSLDGRGLGAQIVAQMPVVGEDIFLRKWLVEAVCLGEAREGSQILGIGSERVVSEAALVAARVNEGGVIKMGHAELLWLSSASSTQARHRAEIGLLGGNDNGPLSSELSFSKVPLGDRNADGATIR